MIMKKGIIIIVFVLILFGFVGCYTPKKVNNEINKSYLFYSYSDGAAKDVAYFVDKSGNIKKIKTKKTSNVSENYYDAYSDSYILKNRLDCQLSVFDNDGNVNEFDPCEIGESYNGIVSHITYSKDTYFMVLDNGFDNEKYNNIIRIISKDLKHIKDIVVNQVIFDILYFDNNLYYIKAAKDYQLNNDADIEEHIYKMSLKNYQEKKININDEKKKKILMDSIMFNEGKLYIY